MAKIHWSGAASPSDCNNSRVVRSVGSRVTCNSNRASGVSHGRSGDGCLSTSRAAGKAAATAAATLCPSSRCGSRCFSAFNNKAAACGQKLPVSHEQVVSNSQLPPLCQRLTSASSAATEPDKHAAPAPAASKRKSRTLDSNAGAAARMSSSKRRCQRQSLRKAWMSGASGKVVPLF